MPWLRTQSFVGNAPIHIMAGITLESFVEQVELATLAAANMAAPAQPSPQ
ncbi:hypothetical protein PQR53_22200 [Paraburkholderia fungorum]